MIKNALNILRSAPEKTIAHSVRVAASPSLLSEYEIALALLHDVFEDDMSISEDDLLDAGFSTSFVTDVLTLTRRLGESYEAYIERVLASKTPFVIRVKLADLHVNFCRCSDSLAERYARALRRFGEEGYTL